MFLVYVLVKWTGLLLISAVHRSIMISPPLLLAVKLHGAETNPDGRMTGCDSVDRELDFLMSCLLELPIELSEGCLGSALVRM